MHTRALTRRTMLGSGSCILAATLLSPSRARAISESGLSMKSAALIRRYYMTWENNDWDSLDALLANGFTFSSAAGDDHISKSTFKTQCWDTQSSHIQRFDLMRVVATDADAFVMYDCYTTGGKTFRNVEYFRLKDGKVEAIECYFGGAAGYPTAAGAT
jgi:ketosteroid isomerase-like protein